MEQRLLPTSLPADGPESLEAYRARGGYETWLRVWREGDRGAIIRAVERSGLRGRGGAGFSTSKKWSFMPVDARGRAYLCMNADESEPGTFKDRHLMERVPHLVLEGLLIACYAAGATRGVVFVRCEYARAAERMEQAIGEARAAGLLDCDAGDGAPLDIVIRKGAGTYISGEETALLESAEGKRGWPRQKPPFPAGRGLLGRPTTINNVETLCCVPLVLSVGPEAFAAVGSEGNTGMKLYCLSGHVRRPGVYESAMTVTVRDLVFDERFGGGVAGGSGLKAVIPGGSSAPVLRADEIDVVADFDHLAAGGSMIGSAGLIVMNETTCMVRAAANTARFFDHETCGQCTPCREGSHWVRQILDRIEAGQGRDGDVELVLDRLDHIAGQTICPFGEAVAWGVGGIVKKFRGEFLEHNRLGRCPMPAWGFRRAEA
jgi:NADH-quinone oxidoreductase subunit F